MRGPDVPSLAHAAVAPSTNPKCERNARQVLTRAAVTRTLTFPSAGDRAVRVAQPQ